MPCETLRDDAGRMIGVACGRRMKPEPSCDFCSRERVALCDHRVTAAGKTCDAKLCRLHRTRIGPNLDACPAHATVEARQPSLL